MSTGKPIKSAYLVTFNVVSFAAWSYVLYLCIVNIANGGSTGELYKVVEHPLQIAQTMAVLEILHAASGLVRSPVFTVMQQVASRLFIVWGILFAAPKATTTGSIKLAECAPLTLVPRSTYLRLGVMVAALDLHSLLLSWGITEVVRYPFYAFKEVGVEPFILSWLRYTLFIVLYPLGVSSECAMVLLALPELKREGVWSMQMPNAFNIDFSYHWLCVMILLCYVPGFPPLYMYMFKQRKKVLSPASAKVKTP